MCMYTYICTAAEAGSCEITVPEYNLLPYDARGWTSAEEAWAVLITSLVRESLSEIKLTSRPEHMQVCAQ